jgi:hypothetical protein
MSMKILSRLLVAFAACSLFSPAAHGAGKPVGAALIVAPSRYPVLSFCFDVATLRPIYLVAYDETTGTAAPRLHVWDSSVKQWIKLDLARYRSGDPFINPPPSYVVLIGKDVATRIGAPLPEGAEVCPIYSADPASLANGLNDFMHFETGEWRWLARRHDIKVEDTNAERRRYGKYGKPVKEPKVTPFPPESSELEPVPLPPVNPEPMPPVGATPAVSNATPPEVTTQTVEPGPDPPAAEEEEKPAAVKPVSPDKGAGSKPPAVDKPAADSLDAGPIEKPAADK